MGRKTSGDVGSVIRASPRGSILSCIIFALD